MKKRITIALLIISFLSNLIANFILSETECYTAAILLFVLHVACIGFALGIIEEYWKD